MNERIPTTATAMFEYQRRKILCKKEISKMHYLNIKLENLLHAEINLHIHQSKGS